MDEETQRYACFAKPLREHPAKFVAIATFLGRDEESAGECLSRCLQRRNHTQALVGIQELKANAERDLCFLLFREFLQAFGARVDLQTAVCPPEIFDIRLLPYSLQELGTIEGEAEDMLGVLHETVAPEQDRNCSPQRHITGICDGCSRIGASGLSIVEMTFSKTPGDDQGAA